MYLHIILQLVVVEVEDSMYLEVVEQVAYEQMTL